MKQLFTMEELQTALQGDCFLLLKHSNTCPVSTSGYEEVERYLEEHPEQAHGFLVVQESRDFSAAVAELTGIRHESPQVILFKSGKPVWQASHYSIKKDAIADAMAEVPK